MFIKSEEILYIILQLTILKKSNRNFFIIFSIRNYPESYPGEQESNDEICGNQLDPLKIMYVHCTMCTSFRWGIPQTFMWRKWYFHCTREKNLHFKGNGIGFTFDKIVESKNKDRYFFTPLCLSLTKGSRVV